MSVSCQYIRSTGLNCSEGLLHWSVLCAVTPTLHTLCCIHGLKARADVTHPLYTLLKLLHWNHCYLIENSLCSSQFIKTKSELIRRREKGVRPHRGCILLIVQLYCFFSMDLNSEQISTEQSLDFSTGYMWDKGFWGRTWMGETRAGTEHARHVCFKLKACQRTALKHAGPCECLQMTSLFKNSSTSYSTALAGRFMLYFKQWY